MSCPCPACSRLAAAAEASDQAIPEDEHIKAAHPTRSGRHDTYQEAMRLVGAKKSKASLVALVNWLLLEREQAAKGGGG